MLPCAPISTLFPYTTLFRSADCCEDWIIEWGGFYKPERAFRCPECATEWTKSGSDTYRRGDGRAFQRRTRVGPQASFPYLDRKSTRLNSSHANISYAVFCLK